ncbi:MAG: hypothetical protein R6X11_00395 [Desulfonatronovibrio sp.]
MKKKEKKKITKGTIAVGKKKKKYSVIGVEKLKDDSGFKIKLIAAANGNPAVT